VFGEFGVPAAITTYTHLSEQCVSTYRTAMQRQLGIIWVGVTNAQTIITFSFTCTVSILLTLFNTLLQ